MSERKLKENKNRIKYNYHRDVFLRVYEKFLNKK